MESENNINLNVWKKETHSEIFSINPFITIEKIIDTQIESYVFAILHMHFNGFVLYVCEKDDYSHKNSGEVVL